MIYPLLAKQSIIDCLNTMYGINVSVPISIAGDTDLHSETYKVETPNQGSYFVKIKRDVCHDTNIALQLLLYNAGIKLIIAPIKAIDNKSFSRNQRFCDYCICLH